MAAIEAGTHPAHPTRRRSSNPHRRPSLDLASRWRTVRERFTWWEITLFVVGVVASCSVISALFFALGDQPSRIYSRTPLPAVDALEFSTVLSNLVGAPVDEGGTITPLDNGDQFIPVLMTAIEHARQSINFSVYIWKDGAFSDRLLDALLEKQRQGVQVRILLDGFGSSIRDSKFDPLRQAGAQVEKYRTPRFGQLTRFHRRNHRRSIVIDGETGFTGGIAVSDVWLGHAQDSDHWRDMMFEVTGPLATRLQSGFVDTWISSSGEILAGPQVYPEPSVSSSVGVRRFIHLANSPADDEQSMAYFFLLPVLAARESIYVTTPYFIPDVHLMRALEDKAREGIDVRLLLPGIHTDNWIARASSQGRYDPLLQAGVKIYEYQPTFVHAKATVIDGEWSIVGSPNLDYRGRQLDEENAFGILDATLAGRLQRAFFSNLQRAKAIDLVHWRKRNPLHRAFETLSHILDQQS